MSTEKLYDKKQISFDDFSNKLKNLFEPYSSQIEELCQISFDDFIKGQFCLAASYSKMRDDSDWDDYDSDPDNKKAHSELEKLLKSLTEEAAKRFTTKYKAFLEKELADTPMMKKEKQENELEAKLLEKFLTEIEKEAREKAMNPQNFEMVVVPLSESYNRNGIFSSSPKHDLSQAEIQNRRDPLSNSDDDTRENTLPMDQI
jgi:hypothetical protein